MFASLLRMLKLFTVAVGAIVLLLSGLWAVSCFQAWRQNAFEDRFSFLEGKIEDYRKIMNAPHDHAISSVEPIQLSGKPIVICAGPNDNNPWPLRRNTSQIDPLMTSLPAGLVPRTTDEIKYVVSLRWGDEVVGTFSDGSVAIRETCLVDVFETASGKRILSRNFVGGEPPTSKRENKNSSSREKVYGAGCQYEIVKYFGQIFNAI